MLTEKIMVSYYVVLSQKVIFAARYYQ